MALWHHCHMFNQSWQVIIILKFQISSIPVSWDGLDKCVTKKYSSKWKKWNSFSLCLHLKNSKNNQKSHKITLPYLLLDSPWAMVLKEVGGQKGSHWRWLLGKLEDLEQIPKRNGDRGVPSRWSEETPMSQGKPLTREPFSRHGHHGTQVSYRFVYFSKSGITWRPTVNGN